MKNSGVVDTHRRLSEKRQLKTSLQQKLSFAQAALRLTELPVEICHDCLMGPRVLSTLWAANALGIAPSGVKITCSSLSCVLFPFSVSFQHVQSSNQCAAWTINI